jgi:hypothetical protein
MFVSAGAAQAQAEPSWGGLTPAPSAGWDLEPEEAPARGNTTSPIYVGPNALDYIFMPITGLLGGVAGIFITIFTLNAVINNGCAKDIGEIMSDRSECSTLPYLIGVVSYPLWNSLSIYAYGEARGLEGSLLGAILGSAGGSLLAWGLFYLDGEAFVLTIPLFPLIGGTIGYMLGTPAPGTRLPTALLDYSPGEGLSVGLPAVGVSVDPDRAETRVMVPLLSGSF